MSEERLSYLFLQYLKNTCSQQEMEEFFAYISKAKTDTQLRDLIKKVFEDIKQSHPSLSYVDEAGKLVFAEPGEEYHTPFIVKRGKKNLAKALLMAACAIIIAGVTWFSSKPVNNNAIAGVKALTTKFTERKEQKYLLLPDSTQVWLNAASSLQYPDEFKPGKREVYLTGEAYFDVKHADKIPFLIHTRNITTIVLGTAFNIRAYADQHEITVAVTRGKVKVNRDDKLVAVLTKGKAVKINNTTEEIIEKEVTVENIAGWQQGNLEYDDAALEDIVKDLQNVFNTEIKIGDTAIGRLRFNTTLRRESGAEKNLDILAQTINKKVVNQNGILIIK